MQTETQAPGLRRARLKLFFGAAPGVGLTSAMLKEAHERAAAGVDVVAGCVEPRGRAEVSSQMEGIEAFPRRMLRYQGQPVETMDLEGLLRRRPGLVLVEDLAFPNPRGARHSYRWQDVLELLEAGIDVCATLDVTHLESLRDAVARITGLKVPATVPDAVLDRADEIRLLDLPVEDLQERHRLGKAVLREGFQYASERFFRKGNLLALREMALRKTAERVDADLERYRDEKAIKQSWHAGERLLVAIGPRSSSAELIRATARLASALNAPWIAVYVESSRRWIRSRKAREGLEANLRLAEQLGGEIVTIEQAGLRASDDLLSFARSRHVTKIVMGKPGRSHWLDLFSGSVLDDLVRQGGEIDIFVIAGEQGKGTRPSFKFPKAPLVALPVLGGAVSSGVLAAVLLAAYPWVGTHLALACFAVLVVLVATRLGRYPALVAALVSALAYRWIWMFPHGALRLGRAQDGVTLMLLLFLAVLAGEVTERLRRLAKFSIERERRTQALLRFGLELAEGGASAQLTEIAVRHLAQVFGLEARVLLPWGDGALKLEPDLGGPEGEAAGWAFEHALSTGKGSDHFNTCEGLYLPLVGGTSPVGVLALRERIVSKRFGPPQRQLLEAFARQAALAIERALLAEQNSAVQGRMHREEVRTALLSSVSQSLEVPLKNLSDLAGDLRLSLRDHHGREQVEAIHHESRRLHRLVASLIRLTNLERGTLQLHRTWMGLPPILDRAREVLGEALKGRDLVVNLPSAPVPLDSALIEELFVHLLDNAQRYSPPGSPIDVKGWIVGETFTFAVADHGPGIPEGEESRLFEKLIKGTRTASRPGGGLGLAICRGIVEAHGGSIQAHTRPTGGAQFLVTLPIEGTPPVHRSHDRTEE